MSKTSHEWLIEAIASSEGDRSAATWLAVNLAEKEQEIERLNKIVKALERTYEEESKAEFQEVEIGRRFIEISEKFMAATCDESKKEATAYPFWTVEYSETRIQCGVFFSREAAEEYRLSKKNPDRFAVYCDSGKGSEAYEAILDLAQKVLGGNPD